MMTQFRSCAVFVAYYWAATTPHNDRQQTRACHARLFMHNGPCGQPCPCVSQPDNLGENTQPKDINKPCCTFCVRTIAVQMPGASFMSQCRLTVWKMYVSPKSNIEIHTFPKSVYTDLCFLAVFALSLEKDP